MVSYSGKIARLPGILRVFVCRELGVSLIETVVVLAVLGTVAVIFLTGMMISSEAAFITDEQATAENLARSQMEWVQSTGYDAAGYSTAAIPSGKDYIDYSVNVTAQRLHATEDGIQKITVIVSHSGGQVFTLESYKVDREN